MWVYGCGLEQSTGPKLVLFDYQDSRSSIHPTDFLAGFAGYLQVDGYAGYEKTHATLVGCWAHARRKFVEAQKRRVKAKRVRRMWPLTISRNSMHWRVN